MSLKNKIVRGAFTLLIGVGVYSLGTLKGHKQGYKDGYHQGANHTHKLRDEVELDDLKSIELKDDNLDGIQDIVLSNSEGKTKWFYGTTDGKFKQVHYFMGTKQEGIKEVETFDGTRLPYNL